MLPTKEKKRLKENIPENKRNKVSGNNKTWLKTEREDM